MTPRLPSWCYAYSGNAYGIEAARGGGRVSREVQVHRAICCWDAAIARGFVCC